MCDNRLTMRHSGTVVILPALFLLILLGCTKKVTTSTSQNNTYYEDLSGTLPEINNYKSPKPFNSLHQDTVFSAPQLDVTTKVSTLLDSMYSLNMRTQFSELTILVYNGNSREAAEQARMDVFKLVPGSKPILEFIAPTYRIKVGNYYDELGAYQVLQKIKSLYPNAIIVPEPVYFK